MRAPPLRAALEVARLQLPTLARKVVVGLPRAPAEDRLPLVQTEVVREPLRELVAVEVGVVDRQQVHQIRRTHGHGISEEHHLLHVDDVLVVRPPAVLRRREVELVVVGPGDLRVVDLRKAELPERQVHGVRRRPDVGGSPVVARGARVVSRSPGRRPRRYPPMTGCPRPSARHSLRLRRRRTPRRDPSWYRYRWEAHPPGRWRRDFRWRPRR